MLRSPDAASVERVRAVDVAVRDMYRLSKFPKTEPYFGVKASYRFDDPSGAIGAAAFGVLYVAHDPETAFCESIIHGNAFFFGGTYQVPRAELQSRHLVTFSHPSRSTLTLADLTGDALKAIGLNNDISAGTDYTVPQQWASAIHAAHPLLDGIRYVSRQHNSVYCYAVFERSGLARDSYVALPDDMADALCGKFNVTRV